MSDLPPNNPDFYIQQDKINNPPIEHRLLEYPKMSREVGEVIITIKDGVAKITKKAEKKQVSDETKQETQELNEEWKAEFIERLKKLPDYELSYVKEIIEKGNIDILRIPNRKAYAIYDNSSGNLIYITGLNGEQYIDIHHFRNKDIYGDAIKGGFVNQGYKKIEFDEKKGLWSLYRKNGEEVPVKSDEYNTATLNSVNYLFDFIDYVENKAKQLKEKE